MIAINFSEEERQALVNLLECAISEMHTEILHTDRRELRNCLKDRRQLLLLLMNRLQEASSTIADNPKL